MKVHMYVNFKEYLYFSLFSSVTSAALNTIQISYGIGYFRQRNSSDIFTYNIARQSVVDKMVREISLKVREKSGKKSGNFVFTFLWEPCYIQYIYITQIVVLVSEPVRGRSWATELPCCFDNLDLV